MSSRKADLLRVLGILVGSSALGLLANAFTRRPVPILAPDGPGAWEDRAPRLGVAELKRALSAGRPVAILDVRSDASYDSGHPAAAFHTPWDRFLEHYARLGLRETLREADPIVVLCDSESCSAGDEVARRLKTLGHDRATVLLGGWPSYRDSGLEIKRQ